MSFGKNLSGEYFDHYKKYVEEYGDKTCIFMQIGSFYEMQKLVTTTTSLGNLDEVCGLLHIQITRKNKKEEVNLEDGALYFAGFPKHAVAKFMPILLDNGYTVVVIDEVGKKGNKSVRKETGIYSPSMYPLDFTEDAKGSNLTSVLVEIYNSKLVKSEFTLAYSVCNVDTSTNYFSVYESSKCGNIPGQVFESFLDDLVRLSTQYNTSEMLFTIIGDVDVIPQQLEKQSVSDYLDMNHTCLHWKHISKRDTAGHQRYKEYQKPSFQNSYFKKVYKHIDFGMLQPLQYFDLEQYQLTTLNCLYTIEFMSRHDTKYIENLAIPVMVDQVQHLTLEMNTVQQLNVVPSHSYTNHRLGSLFDVIDKTSTSVGRRGLKRLLCQPFRTVEAISSRLDLVDSMEDLSNEAKKEIDKCLSDLSDFERLHRRMSLQVLHPHEFYNLHCTYEGIIKIYEILNECCSGVLSNSNLKLTNAHMDVLVCFVNEYKSIINIDEIRKYSLHETAISIGNYFQKGAVPDVDEVCTKIDNIENEVEKLRKYYENKINVKGDGQEWLKTTYSEQDGYYFLCTKIRTQALQKQLSKKEVADISIKSNTSVCKITNSQLKKLSLDLINYREVFVKKIKLNYLTFLAKWAEKYNKMFEPLRTFIQILDITLCNIKCKNLYKYCKPELVDGEDSFVEATEMRHPIIERLNQNTQYIPNDISLNSTKQGMILYALNSCGKSSLLRSIGLSIIMAQCGLYVPCKTFKLAPFDSIITQVDLNDNLWKSQSSFVSEMVGLRKIMKCASNKTLVLSDELTKGTEVVSATSIFAASVLELVKRGCKFVFTTHLQDVAKLQEIQECKELMICHLSVDIHDDCITFERKLKPGPCSELYGLEVARAIGLDKELMDLSFALRNKLVNKKQEPQLKKSRYNKSKLLQECEVCGYTPVKPTDLPLDTHHIQFQCNADENQFNGHFHKNSKFNLVSLCKQCHTTVHSGGIVINGYKTTTKGVQLDYVKSS